MLSLVPCPADPICWPERHPGSSGSHGEGPQARDSSGHSCGSGCAHLRVLGCAACLEACIPRHRQPAVLDSSALVTYVPPDILWFFLPERERGGRGGGRERERENENE